MRTSQWNRQNRLVKGLETFFQEQTYDTSLLSKEWRTANFSSLVLSPVSRIFSLLCENPDYSVYKDGNTLNLVMDRGRHRGVIQFSNFRYTRDENGLLHPHQAFDFSTSINVFLPTNKVRKFLNEFQEAINNIPAYELLVGGNGTDFVRHQNLAFSDISSNVIVKTFDKDYTGLVIPVFKDVKCEFPRDESEIIRAHSFVRDMKSILKIHSRLTRMADKLSKERAMKESPAPKMR